MSVNFDAIYALAKDREPCNKEIYGPNEFYGAAQIFKSCAELDENKTIKASIEHGPTLNDYVWDADKDAVLPALITPSISRFNLLRRHTNKALFAIGSLLSYVNEEDLKEEICAERARLGNNLLCFAPHSTHWINPEYDLDGFCARVLEMGKGFKTVRVCLFWKDVLAGFAQKYAVYGLECVSAGHMYDQLFTARLRRIIEAADETVSIHVGTHIGYSVLLGKPHYLMRQDVGASSDSTVYQEIIHKVGLNDRTSYSNVYEIFDKHYGYITEEQQKFVDQWWGTAQVRTPSELRMIFDICEDMYRKGKEYFMNTPDLMLHQLRDYVNAGEHTKARFLAREAIKVYPEHVERLRDIAQRGV